MGACKMIVFQLHQQEGNHSNKGCSQLWRKENPIDHSGRLRKDLNMTSRISRSCCCKGHSIAIMPAVVGPNASTYMNHLGVVQPWIIDPKVIRVPHVFINSHVRSLNHT